MTGGSTWRNLMYSLIWQSVMWRPGKGRVPMGVKTPLPIRPAAIASQRTPPGPRRSPGSQRQSGYALLPSRTWRHFLIQPGAPFSPCLPRRSTTIRMTYADLAAARGISLDAARRLVLRKRWSKQIGNDGLTRALVPAEYTESVGGDIGTDNGREDGTDTAIILADASVSSVAQTTAALVLDG